MAKNRKEELVDVYHGTTYWNALQIAALKPGGLRPAPWRKYVYVTTDINRATKYAKAWTAAYLQKNYVDQKVPIPGDQLKGGVIWFKVPKSMLKSDPYNPQGEPDQFIVEGGIPKKYIHDWSAQAFPDMEDPNVILMNYTYWMGVVIPDEGIELAEEAEPESNLPRRPPSSGKSGSKTVRAYRRRQ